ncbi:hypothetical protein TNCV_5070201 [Trichonephila clavipes]|nr:hypothetical protein TNCV_5070201 [Trichonephila clavipes]
MQASLKFRFVENSIKRAALCSTYRNTFRIPDPSKNSLPRAMTARDDRHLSIIAKQLIWSTSFWKERMDWPLTSSDLIPAERVWNTLRRAIATPLQEPAKGFKTKVSERVGIIATATQKLPYF